MSARRGFRPGVLGIVSFLLLTAGAATIARPMVHLVRRTHARISARAEWEKWVQSGRTVAGVGEPAGWMSVPAAGIDTIVLWGDTEYNLQHYPCLSARSISFAERDVVKVVAAHRDTHFRTLGNVAVGDEVHITLGDRRELRYRIVDIEVIPREMAVSRVAARDGSDWLVLMTCYPFTFAGPAPDRLLLWARPARETAEQDHTPAPVERRKGGRPSYYSPPPARDRECAPPTPLSRPSGGAASFAIHNGEENSAQSRPLPGLGSGMFRDLLPGHPDGA